VKTSLDLIALATIQAVRPYGRDLVNTDAGGEKQARGEEAETEPEKSGNHHGN